MTLVYDPTGVSPANLVAAEQHTVTEPAIFSNEGPFYRSGLIVTARLDSNNAAVTLTEYVDFVMSPLFSERSADTGREVYSFIVLTNYTIYSTVTLHYQGVGGDPDQVLLDEIIAAGQFDRANLNNWLSFVGDITSINTIGADHNLKNTSVAYLFASKLNTIAQALQTPSAYITFINGAFATLQSTVSGLVSQVNALDASIGNSGGNTSDFVTTGELDSVVIAINADITTVDNKVVALAAKAITLLSGNLTIYVTDTPGVTQTGLTPETATGSIAAAYKIIAGYVDNGHSATIQLLDGIHSGASLSNTPGTSIKVKGNELTPGNVIVTSELTIGNSIVTVSGITFTNISGNGNCLDIRNSAQVNFGVGIVFDTCIPGAHIAITQNGILNIFNDYSIIGNAPKHISIASGGYLHTAGAHITLTGIPAFSDTFILIKRGEALFPVGVTFTGTAIGVKYMVSELGVLDLNNQGISYLPGDVAGTIDSATFGLLL